MSLCPALAAAAAQTPPRNCAGRDPRTALSGARGSKLCWRRAPAAARAPGPEGTSHSGPRHLLLFLRFLHSGRCPGGPHCQELALLPDTLTPWPSSGEPRACAVPNLGAISHERPGGAFTLRGGHVWGSGLSRKGTGSARGEAEAPRARGCGLEPHSQPPRAAPAVGSSKPGPEAGETLGPRRAALEPSATWRRPRGYLSSALGAPPGCAPGACSSCRPRPPRPLGRTPLARPRLRTVGLRRRLALRLPVRRAASPADRGALSSHRLAGGGRPTPGPGGGRPRLRGRRRRRLGIRGAPGDRGRN